MEPIRFADVLFTALTLLVIYLILKLVNKSKQKKGNPPEATPAPVAESSPEEDPSKD